MAKVRTVNEERQSRYGGTYTAPLKIVRCCGEDIECRRFTQTCDHCGADYNMSGARLAPREQWGEETGESWQDCY